MREEFDLLGPPKEMGLLDRVITGERILPHEWEQATQLEILELEVLINNVELPEEHRRTLHESLAVSLRALVGDERTPAHLRVAVADLVVERDGFRELVRATEQAPDLEPISRPNRAQRRASAKIRPRAEVRRRKQRRRKRRGRK